MTGKLIPVITTRGLAAVFNAQNDGLSARITHIALGDHGHIASKDDTSLTNEKLRVPIADGERISDHQIHVSALADDKKEFWIKEVGFFLEDGTMLAIWASSDPLAYKSKEIPLLLGFDLALEALPAQSVTVVGTGADLSLAAYADKFISNATHSINAQIGVIKNAHWNLTLSEKLRAME